MSDMPSVSSMPTQQPSFYPSVSPLPTFSPTVAPTLPPTVGPSASPTATLKGSVKSRVVLATKGKGRRQLAEIPNASANCTKAAEDTTKELVEACLEPPNERVSSVSTVKVLPSNEEEAQTFFQDVTIESEVAVSFDALNACINKSVVDNNATETLRSNAKENGCDELEEGTVESLTLSEDADTPSIGPTLSPVADSPTISPVTDSPTSTPTMDAIAKSGKSMGEGKAGKGSTKSGKSSGDGSMSPTTSSKSGKSTVGKANKVNVPSTTSAKSVKTGSRDPSMSNSSSESSVEEPESIEIIEEVKDTTKESVDVEKAEDEENDAPSRGVIDFLFNLIFGEGN